MLNKDLIARKYLSDRERFADIMNAGLFSGKEILKGEDLESAEGSSGMVYERKGRKDTLGRQRDVIRKSAFGTNFALLGIEEQSAVHYAMPVRVMGYDFLEYERQLGEIRKTHRQKRDLTGDAYTSGFSQEDRLKPMLTMVLYCGEAPWDGPCQLSQMLDWRDIPEEIRERTADYPIHVLDVRRFPGTEELRTDARIVFGFLKRQASKKELREYVEENREAFARMDEEAYDMISAWSGSQTLMQSKEAYRNEKGEIDLCKALQDMKEEERSQGREEGREEGQEQINALYRKLKKAGRIGELMRAIDDEEFRKGLLEKEQNHMENG